MYAIYQSRGMVHGRGVGLGLVRGRGLGLCRELLRRLGQAYGRRRCRCRGLVQIRVQYISIIFWEFFLLRKVLMNIEVGKFYKTRDGRKARIYAVDGVKDFPIHGAVYTGNDEWCGTIWRFGGRSRELVDSSMDLISEWVEPRSGSFWVNVYDIEQTSPAHISPAYLSKDLANRTAGRLRMACVEVKWTEGDGL